MFDHKTSGLYQAEEAGMLYAADTDADYVHTQHDQDVTDDEAADEGWTGDLRDVAVQYGPSDGRHPGESVTIFTQDAHEIDFGDSDEW